VEEVIKLRSPVSCAPSAAQSSRVEDKPFIVHAT